MPLLVTGCVLAAGAPVGEERVEGGGLEHGADEHMLAGVGGLFEHDDAKRRGGGGVELSEADGGGQAAAHDADVHGLRQPVGLGHRDVRRVVGRKAGERPAQGGQGGEHRKERWR
ncbi:hypothetical protein C8J57DRAFT_1237582 [Mycena rebaudengoi]|nr:hypothetical protein C8J57DRAFT_1237582 [Mycena rebaudengoi]